MPRGSEAAVLDRSLRQVERYEGRAPPQARPGCGRAASLSSAAAVMCTFPFWNDPIDANQIFADGDEPRGHCRYTTTPDIVVI